MVASPVAGQIPLVRADPFALDVTGYVGMLTGVHDAGFALPGQDVTSGFHGTVVRLKWKARLNGSAVLEVHDRILASLTSQGARPVVGFGTSRTPGRAIDLSSPWVEKDRLSVLHDVDRLALTLYTGPVDLTIGRQAVTWGSALLFPVADLFAAFSPFELDTEEKPGVDAVRALAYPSPKAELDFVLAGRDRAEDISFGARVSVSGEHTEGWAAAGKFWREAMLMAGLTRVGESARLRIEVVQPWDLDGAGALDPRVTLGADRIGARLTLSLEAHFNGLGARDVAGYAAALAAPAFGRGETYYLGRWYLGGLAAWTPDTAGRVSLSLVSLLNLEDGSASLTPTLSYDLDQHARVSLGGLASVGGAPAPAAGELLPHLESEFGSYGDLGFLRLSVYF